MSEIDLAGLERETFRRLAHYTRSIDAKDWDTLSEVFADDCVKDRRGIDGLSRGAVVTGGGRIIEDLSVSLGKCGPTQHFLAIMPPRYSTAAMSKASPTFEHFIAAPVRTGIYGWTSWASIT
jgi:hypothetical protein